MKLNWRFGYSDLNLLQFLNDEIKKLLFKDAMKANASEKGRVLMQKYTPLPESFYRQETLCLARRLLGKLFIRKINGKILIGKIVETEAYHQNGDPSCHAHRGKTPRNMVMFGPPGHLYVYFTYGMHFCMNIVSEEEGVAAAVLIRALEPLEGLPTMQKFRGQKVTLYNLASGPAKLCQAFAIGRNENGISLQSKSLFLAGFDKDNNDLSEQDIVVTTRIGISQGKDLPWRFYIKNNPFVSRK